MSWSTLRVAQVPPRSLTSLSNDNLLAILEHLSVPTLLMLLSASRRLNTLIRQVTLPCYRSVIFRPPTHLVANYDLRKSAVLLFTRRFRLPIYFYPTISLRAHSRGTGLPRGRQQPFESLLASFPAHLPALLPRLGSFTYAYFLKEVALYESSSKLSGEEGRINGLFTGYLQSPAWCTGLVSLELHLVVGPASHTLGEPLFAHLNTLTQLRHLTLHCYPPMDDHFIATTNPKPRVWVNNESSFTHSGGQYRHRLLPQTLPLLGRLLSFSLSRYLAENIATLLDQLGPNLQSLGLFSVNCSEADFLAFLRSKPSYRTTLRSIEIHLKDNLAHMRGPGAARGLPMERLFGPLFGNLFTFLGDLSRLSHLREMAYLLSICKLRSLRDNYPGASLPRFTSLRRVRLSIGCAFSGTWEDFKAAELFDDHVPALGAIFGAVEHVEIQFGYSSEQSELSASLSEQLVASMVAHFPTARTCKGKYWKRVSK